MRASFAEHKPMANANTIFQALIVEDDDLQREFLTSLLRRMKDFSLELELAVDLQSGIQQLSEHAFDIVLLDLSLPDSYGIETLREFYQVAPLTPIIILTGNEDESLALEAMRNGAQDYLLKQDLNGQGLVRSIRYAVERGRLVQRLFESEERFRGTFEQAAMGLAHLSLAHDFLRVNQKTCEILCVSQEELLSKTLSDISCPSLFHKHKDGMKHLLANEARNYTVEERYIQPDGGAIWIQLTVSLILSNDATPSYFVAVIEDISDRKIAEAKLQYAAFYDPLTNLPNRTLLNNRLKYAIVRHRRHPAYLFALLFLDLDRFKNINDSLGHLVGDTLLVEVGHRISTTLREEDTVARWGGDEFVILLDTIKDLKDAMRVSQRILESLERPYDLRGNEVYISGSTGIVMCSSEYQSAEEMLRDADTAMFQSKTNGRSRQTVFHQRMQHRVLNQFQLESALRNAIVRDELCVFYQPIIALDTEQLVGFEALVRWKRPGVGLVSPMDFIPLAEETGLIVSMDLWVLMQACQQAALWRTAYPNQELFVSVNLSSLHFVQKEDSLIDSVRHAIQSHDIPPECIRLEITESAIIQNQKQAIALLEELQTLGVLVYMDDFGTGYSSLSYLQRFPMDALKVDRSFVRDIGSDSKQEEIIQLIIILAQKLGLKVVAEGIETTSQMEYLKALGCDYGQGYLFNKPLPIEETTTYIAQSLQPI